MGLNAGARSQPGLGNLERRLKATEAKEPKTYQAGEWRRNDKLREEQSKAERALKRDNDERTRNSQNSTSV